MKNVGYHRTSTREQHLDRGILAIKEFCRENGLELHKDKVYTDQRTGGNFDRPGYLIVKEELLEPGDTLIIKELDRLGRNKQETLRELRHFRENNIRVMILEIPTTLIDTSGMEDSLAAMLMDTINNMMLEMYAAFAQAEMEKRKTRQREGIQAMRERGEWGRYGRPKRMPQHEFDRIYQERVIDGKMRPFEFMRQTDLKMSTYYRYKRAFDERTEKEKKIRSLERARVELRKTLGADIQLSEGQIEKSLADLMATLALEGHEMTEETIRNTREILSGRLDAEELLGESIRKVREGK